MDTNKTFEPRMDTNGHERIQNHEWTLMDTNVLNHEKHERHEKKQNHEWTLMDTNIEADHETHERHEKLRTTNGHEY